MGGWSTRGMTLIAHLSDTHLDGGERALRRTRAVLEWLHGIPVDAILVTGDVTDHGTAAEYEQAAAEFTADVPVLLLPGNHDERSAFRRVLLADDGAAGSTDGHAPLNRLHRVGGLTFALCDSTVPGRSEGRLAAETADWLRAVLAAADGPVLVCLHHPPVLIGHPLMDEIMLRRPEELAAVIEGRPNVAAVLCGHAHQPIATTFAGTPLVVAPGVVSTLRLPWTVPGPLTWSAAVDLDEPPGVALHVIDDVGRVTTHFRSLRS
jgi:3',5'-cyclic-AMP phosphodiesterase